MVSTHCIFVTEFYSEIATANVVYLPVIQMVNFVVTQQGNYCVIRVGYFAVTEAVNYQKPNGILEIDSVDSGLVQNRIRCLAYQKFGKDCYDVTYYDVTNCDFIAISNFSCDSSSPSSILRC